MTRRPLRLASPRTLTAACALALAAGATAQVSPTTQTPKRVGAPASAPPASQSAVPDRPAAGDEASSLKNLVRLTSPEQFHKAGEAYFDPYTRWVIFQAVPKPAEGQSPDAHYSMFVAKLKKDAAGKIVGIEKPIRLSPEGSANTCGFFDPRTPYRVIFGTTLIPPAPPQDASGGASGGGASGGGAGYKRDKGSYVWEFPVEMEVCSRTVDEIFDDILPTARRETSVAADSDRPMPVFVRPGYDAECAYSPDSRFIVYTHVELGASNPDIYIYDVASATHIPLITAPGYDGGPFFSPDGKHVCYRSDRKGDSLLQLMVAELAFDPAPPPPADTNPNDAGPPPSPPLRGLREERAVTANQHVNWAPFWSPDGSFLIYTTSEIGHDNYELFAIEAPVGAAARKPADQLKKRRITTAVGFDGLPVFSKDGRFLMWTSQRPGDAAGLPLDPADPRAASKDSSQVWVAEVINARP